MMFLLLFSTIFVIAFFFKIFQRQRTIDTPKQTPNPPCDKYNDEIRIKKQEIDDEHQEVVIAPRKKKIYPQRKLVNRHGIHHGRVDIEKLTIQLSKSDKKWMEKLIRKEKMKKISKLRFMRMPKTFLYTEENE